MSLWYSADRFSALFGNVELLEEFLATSEFGELDEFVGDEVVASEATGELWPFLLMPTSDMATRISSFCCKKSKKNVSFNTIKFSCLSMTRLTSKLKTKIIYNPQKNSWNHNIAQLIGLMPLCFDVIFQNLQILVKNSSKPRLHSAETKRKRYLTLKNWFPTLSTLFCML